MGLVLIILYENPKESIGSQKKVSYPGVHLQIESTSYVWECPPSSYVSRSLRKYLECVFVSYRILGWL